MGFFKKFQLGKVLGAAVRGYSQGGRAGLVAQGGAALVNSTLGAATARASRSGSSASLSQFGGVQTAFMPGYQTPGTMRVSNDYPMVPVANKSGSTMSKPIYDSLLMLADKLGVTIRNPNAVVPTGKNLLAKLLRFSRATPGLTILTMLVQLGVGVFEANQLISWYSTSGKRRKRIRVTNVKALKRSVRRLEGFRKMSNRVEMALAGRGSTSSRRRVTRCRSCRKSPCAC